MFLNNQLTALIDSISELKASASSEGLEDGLTVVDTNAMQVVLDEVKKLQALKQTLILGSHVHDHGESLYPFLVKDGCKFGEEEFSPYLEESFEPEFGERLLVNTIGEPVLIEDEEMSDTDILLTA